jgi:hypothetical protein
MSITLSDSSTSLTLNPDLFWADEDWLPVTSSSERTLTGALIVSVASMVGGRPITLQPNDESSGWVTQSTLAALRNWAAVPGKVMTLSIRGQSRSVMFRHSDGAIEATPVIHFSDVDSSDYYRAVFRFLEV